VSSGQESHSWSAPPTRGHRVPPESVLIVRDPAAGLHGLFLLAISFLPDFVLVLPIKASDLQPVFILQPKEHARDSVIWALGSGY
jgi:hypothetical protein